LISTYPKCTAGIKRRILDVLTSRPSFCLLLLESVGPAGIPASDVPIEQLRRIAAFKDARLDSLIAKNWGKIAPPSSGEKIAHIRHIATRVLVTKGNADHGKELFTKHCAACHTLFGEGGKTGPDLTTVDRKNREWLVTQIVDPSGVIRP